MPLPYMRSGNDRPHGKAGCPPGGTPIVGADSISAQECLRRGGVARDDASIVPYRGLRHRRVRIFPVGRGPAVGRRGGIYPSRGRLRRGGVRRDEGIPPYGHFIGSAYTGKAACFRRGICGRGMPLPYMPSGNDRPHGKAGCPPGVAARQGCPGGMNPAPTSKFDASHLPVGPRRFPRFVGEGHGPPLGVCGGAGVCGTMRASSLQGVAASPGSHFPGWAARPPWVVGEGFILPRALAAPRGCPAG